MLATSNFAEVGRSYKNIVRVSLGFQRFNFGIWVYSACAEMKLFNQEVLRVILLDTRQRLITMIDVTKGSLNESLAYPRDIFRPVICHSAHAFVLVHNHPSGDPSPSEADLRLTRRLCEAARILQIQMLDHVIIGQPMNRRQGYFSFKEAGTIA